MNSTMHMLEAHEYVIKVTAVDRNPEAAFRLCVAASAL